MRAFIQAKIGKRVRLHTAIRSDVALLKQIAGVAKQIESSIRSGGNLPIAGKGGSASDARHIPSAFVSRFHYDGPVLPAIALTTDRSFLTAIANDYGYERVFSRQILSLAQSPDCFLAILTSGNSKNVLEAIIEAKNKGVYAIGLTGHSGGQMGSLCDVCLKMPSNETPKIQEVHILVVHSLCGLVKSQMFPRT